MTTCRNELHTSAFVRTCPECFEDLVRRLVAAEEPKGRRRKHPVKKAPLSDLTRDPSWAQTIASVVLLTVFLVFLAWRIG